MSGAGRGPPIALRAYDREPSVCGAGYLNLDRSSYWKPYGVLARKAAVFDTAGLSPIRL